MFLDSLRRRFRRRHLSLSEVILVLFAVQLSLASTSASLQQSLLDDTSLGLQMSSTALSEIWLDVNRLSDVLSWQSVDSFDVLSVFSSASSLHLVATVTGEVVPLSVYFDMLMQTRFGHISSKSATPSLLTFACSSVDVPSSFCESMSSAKILKTHTLAIKRNQATNTVKVWPCTRMSADS